MPVTIKLFDLVLLPVSEQFWPSTFRGLIHALESDPGNWVLWGATADWCNDNDEPKLASGFRHVYTTRAKVERSRRLLSDWVIRTGIMVHWMPSIGHQSIAGLAAMIADCMERRKIDYETKLKERCQ